jgi:hypothetical protein
MGPQKRHDGTHPDAMMKDFRVFLNNTQDITHHVSISSGTREIIKHESRNKTHISDEQLHAMELFISHGIELEVEGFDGGCIYQMCRCTGRQSWRGGDRRNDWVWVKQPPGRCYGTVNWHLPWQLQRLFKMKLLNVDGDFIEYRLTLGLTTIPENLGNLDPFLTLV